MIKLILVILFVFAVQDTTKTKKAERYDYKKLQIKMKKQVQKVDTIKMDTIK